MWWHTLGQYNFNLKKRTLSFSLCLSFSSSSSCISRPFLSIRLSLMYKEVMYMCAYVFECAFTHETVTITTLSLLSLTFLPFLSLMLSRGESEKLDGVVEKTRFFTFSVFSCPLPTSLPRCPTFSHFLDKVLKIQNTVKCEEKELDFSHHAMEKLPLPPYSPYVFDQWGFPTN